MEENKGQILLYQTPDGESRIRRDGSSDHFCFGILLKMEDVRCYIIAKNKNVIRNMALPINIENLLGGLVVEGNRVECKIRKIIKI